MRTARDAFADATRRLWRAPWFTVSTLVAIACGTGLNAATYSWSAALTFRPPPGLQRPAELVSIYSEGAYGDEPLAPVSMSEFDAIASSSGSLAGVAAYVDDVGTTVVVHEHQYAFRTGHASPRFFEVLGVQPFLGSLQLNARSAVISHDLWTRIFQEDPNAIGAIFTIDGQPYSVGGVAAPAFRGLGPARATDLWLPLNQPALAQSRQLWALGRLRAGRELAALSRELEHRFVLRPLGRFRNSPRVGLLASLTGSTVVLLCLVVCSSVAGLLLCRTIALGKELAIRMALGASRLQLLKPLLVESCLLCITGTTLGLLVANWTNSALKALLIPELATQLDLSIEPRIFGVGAGLSLVAGILCAIPALSHASAVDASGGLRAANGSTPPASIRKAWALAAAHLAVAMVLMSLPLQLSRATTAALRSFTFSSPSNVAVLALEVPVSAVERWRVRRARRAITERLASTPGVLAVAWATRPPNASYLKRTLRPVDSASMSGVSVESDTVDVSPGYFRLLGIPLLIGRDLDGAAGDTEPVVIVNAEFASRYLGRDPIGRRFEDGHSVATVIGVVGSTQTSATDTASPLVYYPIAGSDTPEMTALVRTASHADGRLNDLAGAARSVEGTVFVNKAESLPRHLQATLQSERLLSRILMLTSGLGLLLSAVTLFNVLRQQVLGRSREFALRTALGATNWNVCSLVMLTSLRVVGAGCVLGLPAVWVIDSWSRARYPYPVDGLSTSLAWISATLVVLGVLAATLPAVQALQNAPSALLKSD